VTGVKVERRAKASAKTPRDIIGRENMAALEQAGFVVVRHSALAKLRALVKSALDSLPPEPSRKNRN
jgi:hypothetical protein